MIRIISTIVVLVILSSCKDQNTITISGEIKNPFNGFVTIQMREGLVYRNIDTIAVNGNDFRYSMKLESADIYRLNFYNLQYVKLILDKDDITVNVDGRNKKGFLEINGSRDHDLINHIITLKEYFESSDKVVAVNNAYKEGYKTGNNDMMDRAHQNYESYRDELDLMIMEMVDEMKPTLAIVDIFQNNLIDRIRYFDFYDKHAQELEKNNYKSSHVNNFLYSINQLRSELASNSKTD